MLNITPIPAFNDNYIWLLQGATRGAAVVVDPGDDEPVVGRLRAAGLELEAILLTHHHMDHSGGVVSLRRRFPRARVFGPAREAIAGVDEALCEGDHVRLESIAADFQVIDLPGHTAGHIAYFGEGALFCGDTLFAAGCGRLFEGTAEQMHASLSKIAALPRDTLLYCAHEYTLANIAFALRVEPDNADLRKRQQAALALRKRGLPTVPSTLDLELITNPFLRFDVPQVARAAERHTGRVLATGTDVFAAVRRWKDTAPA